MTDISEYMNSQGEGPSVLIVDDDAATSHLSVRYCAGNGWMYVKQAMGAMWAFMQRSAAVVITDFQMPGMTGLDLLRSIRAGSADRGDTDHGVRHN